MSSTPSTNETSASAASARAPRKRRAAQWTRNPERSSLWALRSMARLSLAIGRPLSRIALFPITAYFMLFAPSARRASLDYLRRVLGRKASPIDGFRQVYTFATTIHDRIFLINDRFDLFDIRVHGGDLMRDLLEQERGAFLIGAHLGSFEVLSSVGRQFAGLRASMLMYEENAQKINATIAAINPKALLDIIPMGRVDSMLRAGERLDAGEMVGLLADRTPADETTVELPFLGAPAPFPVGPFRVAALMRRPVVFMTATYAGGNAYDVYFEQLADFSDAADGGRRRAERIDAAMRRYVELLEKHCRRAPYNWFNFFPFWSEQSDNDLFCENL
ncbi:acyl-CoA synthetase [Pararobbsia silviterrae]|uniref:Acyl-CoA synthetase n=1 Tax=Pararobbsia silviterrae TaxID=1792498 RepID=A0A494X8M3_9BURK|nr:acyl-CoA synthetase [Pararobbsia silviterrae]RKP46602.1 acyl-CoA synthetase [Pararobbsia silviterrae]